MSILINLYEDKLKSRYVLVIPETRLDTSYVYLLDYLVTGSDRKVSSGSISRCSVYNDYLNEVNIRVVPRDRVRTVCIVSQLALYNLDRTCDPFRHAFLKSQILEWLYESVLKGGISDYHGCDTIERVKVAKTRRYQWKPKAFDSAEPQDVDD